MTQSAAGLPIGSPFPDDLGVVVLERSEGRILLQLEVGPRHLRSMGIIHGGVLASLIDMAVGFAAGTRAAPDQYTVSAQVNMNFIRPAWEGETLLAEGKTVHAGQRTAVAHAEIRTTAGSLVATGAGTMIFLPRPATSNIVRR